MSIINPDTSAENIKEDLDISIIFSTKNGETTLPFMLDGLKKLKIKPDLRWEIIAVDNGSTDSTGVILQSYTKQLPLNIVYESKAGKNSALNTGIKIAKGSLLIFTDDDIIPHENWLSAYDYYAKNEPNYSMFGGHIQPYWLASPKKYIIDNIPIGIAFAITPQSLLTGPINAGKIWGPNMAVRRRLFDDGIRFNENIGPNGSNYIMGSETDFLQNAERTGQKAFFIASTHVQHIIRPWQLTTSWLNQRAFKAGRAIIHDNIRNNIPLSHAKMMFGYPRWAILKAIKLKVKYLLYRLLLKKEVAISAAWEYHLQIGFNVEFRNIYTKSKTL